LTAIDDIYTKGIAAGQKLNRVPVSPVAGSSCGTPAGWAAANYPGPPPGPDQIFNS
jgi:hypothetical protein